MSDCKYRFRKVTLGEEFTVNGYWVTLYCFFDGDKVHHFFTQADYLDNMLLAQEMGYHCSPFYKDILVTPIYHREIYYEILEYVSHTHNY